MYVYICSVSAYMLGLITNLVVFFSWRIFFKYFFVVVLVVVN